MGLILLDLSEAKQAVMTEQRRRRRSYRRNAYAGAQHTRLTFDWTTSLLSPDQEIQYNLRTLRSRSRELCRNNPYAVRFLTLLDSNVIGPNGIILQANVETSSGLDRETNDEIERAWKDWSKKKNASVDAKCSWRDLKGLILTTVAQDGECFIRKVRGYNNRHAFALQLIDADQVDHEYSLRQLPNGNEVRMGVEVDAWGKPQAYYIWTAHPSEYKQKQRERVPASQIEHIYRPLRANQTRGLPWMFAAMIRLQMLGGYEEAELIAARIGASKMGFFKSASGDEYAAEGENEDKTIPMEVSPGTFEQLPNGMDFTPFDPQHPVAAFEPFCKAMLRGVAAGLNVSYHSLANDLTDVNFSSIRQGVLDERDRWRVLQGWFIEHVCEPVQEDWQEMAQLSGALMLPPGEYTDVRWQSRGWQWIDPLKDVNANAIAVEQGFKSRSDVIAEAGGDFEDTLKRLKKENELAAENGVTLGQSLKELTINERD